MTLALEREMTASTTISMEIPCVASLLPKCEWNQLRRTAAGAAAAGS
jgi:hypothetical protein